MYDVLSVMSEVPKSKRGRYGDEYGDILNKVARDEITEGTLKQKLTHHVEQVRLLFCVIHEQVFVLLELQTGGLCAGL